MVCEGKQVPPASLRSRVGMTRGAGFWRGWAGGPGVGRYSHVSQKTRDMGHPFLLTVGENDPITPLADEMVITRMSVSLILAGPASPEEYQR
jgi:hypothetical protein